MRMADVYEPTPENECLNVSIALEGFQQDGELISTAVRRLRAALTERTRERDEALKTSCHVHDVNSQICKRGTMCCSANHDDPIIEAHRAEKARADALQKIVAELQQALETWKSDAPTAREALLERVNELKAAALRPSGEAGK